MIIITNDTKRIFKVLPTKAIEILPTEDSYIQVKNGDFFVKYQYNDSPNYLNYKEVDDLGKALIESREYLNKFFDLAKGLVTELFAGVKDKGGKPYIEHLLYVAEHTTDLRSKLVGILHDAIEDTPVTYGDLKVAFGEDIAEAVEAMSKHKNESNDDYLKRVKSTYFSIEAKISDLSHNMQLDRIPKVTEKDMIRFEKYSKSLEELKNYKELLLYGDL